MPDPARIVVGIDGSEPSRAALRWALAEAALHEATLEVLHAWREPMLFVPHAYDEALVEMGRMDEAALRFIDRELDAIGADGDCPVSIEPAEAQHFPARALIKASERAELVILGRHGGGGFPHELVSPKVVQVAHHAHCPVAVVPDQWNGNGSGIVVGVDGSDHAASALRWAAREAKLRNAELTAVMAWGLLDQHHVDDVHTFDPHYAAHDANDALDIFTRRALDDDSVPIATLAVNDLPASALIDTSAHAELLVVGARGLGGFEGLLLGSVSHRCLTHSTVPTVVVRSTR